MSRRRRREAGHVNHERWLVSYADFITLLFAFFVVLFAISQVDRTRASQLSESIREATGRSLVEGRPEGTRAAPIAPTSARGGDDVAAQTARANVRARLLRQLGDAVALGRVEVLESTEGTVIRFRDAAYFGTGSSSVEPRFVGDMERVADALRTGTEPLRIEGHTDARPVRSTVYRSNWDLSAARASSVLALFAGRGVSTGRMSVAGYAAERPIATNDTDEGRRTNRRVDVVVLHRDGETSTSGTETTTAARRIP